LRTWVVVASITRSPDFRQFMETNIAARGSQPPPTLLTLLSKLFKNVPFLACAKNFVQVGGNNLVDNEYAQRMVWSSSWKGSYFHLH
jgi:hypothetical protein